MSEGGEGVIFDFLRGGGMDLFWNDPMLLLVWKNFFDYAYVSPENFFDLTSPPPSGKFFFDLVKILGNVGQNMTTPPPPPNVDCFATSLPAWRDLRP